MTKLNIAKIKAGSVVDGPGGPRTVVWLQGCSIRCSGCQNWALWPKETSDMLSLEPNKAAAAVMTVATQAPMGQPITITGGEPFDQAEALGPFVKALHGMGGPGTDILIYTGYRYEDLVKTAREGSDQKAAGTYIALLYARTLVDGQYDETKDSPWVQWRGSRNQRPISLASSRVYCQSEGEEFLDEMIEPITREEEWDIPNLEIVGGTIYGTGGLIGSLGLSNIGIVRETERCGEFMEGRT